VTAGDVFTLDLFTQLLVEEYAKLQQASHRDVHDDSKTTTLPIAREIVDTYVADVVKQPWYIDLLNATLGIDDLDAAKARIRLVRERFDRDGQRTTDNLDFGPSTALLEE
jgi:malate synthase